MKRGFLLLCLVALLPVWVYAAQIYGNLRYNGQPAQGVNIEVNCNGKSFNGKTDQYGDYSLNAGERGRCTFRGNYNGRDISPFEVYSSDSAARYDFDLVLVNGRFELRRK